MIAGGACAALGLLFAAACSSGHEPGASDPRLDADIPEVNAAEGGAREAAAPPPAGYDGGVGLGLADVADTPCAMRGGGLAVVLPPPVDVNAALPVSLRRLGVIGARRAAETTDASGFVVFDADGKNAKLVPSTLANGTAVIVGSQLLYAGHNEEDFELDIQPHDANGTPSAVASDLADEDPEGVAGGADGNAALFVWANGFSKTIRARGFGAAPTGTAPYDLARGALIGLPSIAVSTVKDGLFAVVFSGEGPGASQTVFGRGSTTARIGDPSELFSGDVKRTVVGLARTPAGFAVLLTVLDDAEPYAMLVLTDAGGRRTSAGLKLLGTRGAAALAVQGSEIGVLAERRADGAASTVEFRPFDVSGAPVGPWVCLDAPGVNGVADRGGGLVADGSGYSAVFRANDGSISLARFDHLGTGGL
jgi:hypothetical protein